MSAPDPDSIAKGLLANGVDSIHHALEHFSERSGKNGKSRHDDKWIVLSVHHAAECICNALLLQVEPNCSLFSGKGEAAWFPSLSKTLARLESESNRELLANSERQLISLLFQLPDIRHQFMHRLAPEAVDVSIAAMCMIGVLKHLEARHGIQASDIVWQSPSVEGDVISAIRYQRLVEYRNFVELFLHEKYPDRWLPQCPCCSASAVVSLRCEACFEELGSVACPRCEENVYFASGERSIGAMVIECPDCGEKVAIA